jgi:FSR family fosmidomycin resistance protein-like MFS transporter
VLVGSMLAIPPLLAGFLLSGSIIAVVFAGLAGAATIATFAVTIVMGQEYLPGRLGVSAGVTIGLSIGLGGLGAPVLGLVADAHGLRAVFEVIAVLPLLALALTFALPSRAPAATAPTPARRARTSSLPGVRVALARHWGSAKGGTDRSG